MKVFCLLALFALAVAAFPEEDGRVNGENGWYVPQFDGSFLWVDIEEGENLLAKAEKEEQARALIELNSVRFYLYTQRNPTKPEEIIDTKKSVDASYFIGENPTRFVIHGWTQSKSSSMNREISDAWLTHGDLNIIVVDWARARSIEYVSSVSAVPTAGKKVAGMIDFLVKNYGMSLDTLEIAGHSLGAHVAGHAGKDVKTGQVHSIVGLDAALPLFSYDKPNKRLSSTDAFYVESIQTDGGGLGFLKPIGKGAFYPNGGKSQPGCGLDAAGSCSHGRSVTYYVEAVETDNFPTMKCRDYEEAVKKSCGAVYSSARMGAATNAYVVAGDYYVPVYSKAPYGMGN